MILPALGALAIGEVVVLADRPDGLVRLGGHLFAQLGYGDLEDLGPRETGLVDDPLAVHQGEVLGVVGEIGLPGNELLEGVDVIARAVKVGLRVEPHPVAVIGIEGEVAVDDADLVHRVVDLEEAADGEVVPRRKDFGRRAIPAAAEIFFEKVDDAVDAALRRPRP